MNKYDIYRWIERVIDSVENNQQDMTAKRLIHNFERMFKDYQLSRELYNYSICRMPNWNKQLKINAVSSVLKNNIMKKFLWAVAIICLAWVVIFYNLWVGIIIGTIGFILWIIGTIEMNNSLNQY